MKTRYMLADQTIEQEELNELCRWLQTNPWLTKGPLSDEFEHRWGNWLGINYAAFVNSGSSANLMMYYALLVSGRLRNRKVVVPAIAWATTVAPAIQLGFEPIMCEADPHDFGLDMNYLEMLLKEHDPAAVIIVHVLGVPNQMERLLKLKDRYGFVLMEDTCAALGSRYNDQLVGTFGEMSSFSYYYGHHMSCAPDTPIPYIDRDGDFKIESIEKIFESKALGKIKVMAFDNDYKVKFVTPSHIIKHLRNGKRMLRVKLQNNRRVDITEDHSVFIWDTEYMTVRAVKGSELEEGDFVVAPRQLPQPEQISTLNFLEYCCKHEPDRFFVRDFVRSNLKNVVGSWRTKEARRRWNYAERGAMPLSKITDFSGSLRIGLRNQRKGGYIPAVIPVSSPLARFIGFFVAEGSYFSHGVTFAFHIDETEYINDVLQVGKEVFGIQGVVRQSPESHSAQVLFRSAVLKIFLQEYVGIPSGARHKRVPSIVFHFDNECQRAFLYGLFRGDGTRTLEDKRISVASASQELISDVSYLCSMLGIMGAVSQQVKPGNRAIQGRWFYSAGISAFRIGRLDFSPDGDLLVATRAKNGLPEAGYAVPKSHTLHEALKKHEAWGNNQNYKTISLHVVERNVPQVLEEFPHLDKLYHGDLCLLEVINVEEITPQYDDVYDISVPGLENFVGGFQPICLHNSTIEGGMVCTNDEELHDILLYIRSHGWPKDLPKEKEEMQARAHNVINFNRRFTFYYPGFNFRSTDLNAKLGLLQMNKLDDVLKRRIENHKIYQSRFLGAPGFGCQINDRSVICSISFAALAESQEHRERIAAVLAEKQIETRPLGGGNMSRQPFWSERYGSTVFPVADRIHTTSLQLPNHPTLSPDDIHYICDTVLAVKSNG
ncbi:MAG: DegT/DnrJ/EryC1/StrS family aminotransferase [Candidatus Tectomicrobia bacterium]|nr:DegT/DnrJ/EryC1/StrS family aminotransferase [Candidatus Tectomicrobia bacterium]